MKDQSTFIILIQWQRSDEYSVYLPELLKKIPDQIVKVLVSTQWEIWPQKVSIPIPEAYNKSYEAEFMVASKKDIVCLLQDTLQTHPDSKILVLAPYTNQQLYELLQQFSDNSILCTAPFSQVWLKNPQQAVELQKVYESKENFRASMEAWLKEYTLPNQILQDSDTYVDLCKKFWYSDWRPIFLTQVDELTAWWWGISVIYSQRELEDYKNKNLWKKILVSPGVWSKNENDEFMPTYSANGRFVCFPDPKDESLPIIKVGELTKKATWFASMAFEKCNTEKYAFPPFSAIGDQYNVQRNNEYEEQYAKIITEYVTYLYEMIFQETGQYLPIMWGLDFVIDENNKKLIATEINLRKQWPDYFLPFFSDTPIDKLRFDYVLKQGDKEEIKQLFDAYSLSPTNFWWYLKLRPPVWIKWLELLEKKDTNTIAWYEWFWKQNSWEWEMKYWIEKYPHAKELIQEWFVYFVPPKVLTTQEWTKYVQWSYIVWSEQWFDPKKPTLTENWFAILASFSSIIQNT